MAALAVTVSLLVHSAFAATATFAVDIPREDLALALNQMPSKATSRSLTAPNWHEARSLPR